MENITCPELGDVTSDYGSRDTSAEGPFIEGFCSVYSPSRGSSTFLDNVKKSQIGIIGGPRHIVFSGQQLFDCDDGNLGSCVYLFH